MYTILVEKILREFPYFTTGHNFVIRQTKDHSIKVSVVAIPTQLGLASFLDEILKLKINMFTRLIQLIKATGLILNNKKSCKAISWYKSCVMTHTMYHIVR